MQEKEAALLVASGVVQQAFLQRNRDHDKPPGSWLGWSVHLTGQNIPAALYPGLELARGGLRHFATLDSAYDFLGTRLGIGTAAAPNAIPVCVIAQENGQRSGLMGSPPDPGAHPF